jgi:hypothetical protein
MELRGDSANAKSSVTVMVWKLDANTGTLSGDLNLDTAFGYLLPFFRRIRDDSGDPKLRNPLIFNLGTTAADPRKQY